MHQHAGMRLEIRKCLLKLNLRELVPDQHGILPLALS